VDKDGQTLSSRLIHPQPHITAALFTASKGGKFFLSMRRASDFWAVGLRNPFTFAVQSGTARLFINDVD